MLRKSLIALNIIGLLDSAYLTWVKSVEKGVCGVSGGCEVVNTSQYSSIAGVPIAVLGGGAYLVMLAILLLETRRGFFELNGPLLVFGISLAGVLYSVYLTYLELYVIRAICPFCVLSAVVLTLILILSVRRVQRSLRQA